MAFVSNRHCLKVEPIDRGRRITAFFKKVTTMEGITKINEILGLSYAEGAAEAGLNKDDCDTAADFVAKNIMRSKTLAEYERRLQKLDKRAQRNIGCPKKLKLIEKEKGNIQRRLDECAAVLKQAGYYDVEFAKHKRWSKVRKQTGQTMKSIGVHVGIHLAIEHLLEVLQAAIEFIEEILRTVATAIAAPA